MVSALTSLTLKQPRHTIREAITSADCHKHSPPTFLGHMERANHFTMRVQSYALSSGAPLESGHLRTPSCLMSKDSCTEEFICWIQTFSCILQVLSERRLRKALTVASATFLMFKQAWYTVREMDLFVAIHQSKLTLLHLKMVL